MVGARGFEPPTLSSRTMRATKLRHAPTEGARSTEPADDTPRPGEAAMTAPPGPCPREQVSVGGREPDRVVADVLRRTVLGRAVVHPQRSPLRLRDVVADRDVERPAAARAARRHRVLVHERPAGPVEDRDPEARLEHVGVAGDPRGIAGRGPERRPVHEDRRQDVLVVVAGPAGPRARCPRCRRS